MSIHYATDAAIAALARGFLDLTLPKSQWTHAAHFATTLWLMRYAPERDPARAMPGLIRAYNESVGGVNSDTAGYHETITQASIRAARAFLAGRPPGEPLHASVDALMAGPFGRSDWPFVYWSRARLLSVEARRCWIEPDLEPLPF